MAGVSAPIPRIIHQVWLGPNPLPERFAVFQEGWRKLHPEWELRFWTEDNLPSELRCRAIAERLRSPVERCDLMRLEALWQFGGVYVDCDFECVRPLDPLLEETTFFAGSIGPESVNHALMGATRAHPIIDRALSEVRPRTMYGYSKEDTGPLFFNRILAEFPEATIYPSSYFHPVNDEERAAAYAIHHAERSWVDRDALAERLAKAHARLEKSERKRRQLEERLASRPQDLDPARRAKRAAVARGRRLRKQAKTTRKRLGPRARALWEARYRPTYGRSLRLVATRDELPKLLNTLGLVGRGAEVGVRIGRFSERLLRGWEGERLISIDPWAEAPGEEYRDHSNVAQEVQEEYYARTQERLAPYGARSEIWRATSLEAAGRVEDRSLDFVYIDARHDHDSVLEDLTAWFPKVRAGGVLSGHDYLDGIRNGAEYGVKSAVDAFFGARGIPVHRTLETPPRFPSWLVRIPEAN